MFDPTPTPYTMGHFIPTRTPTPTPDNTATTIARADGGGIEGLLLFILVIVAVFAELLRGEQNER